MSGTTPAHRAAPSHRRSVAVVGVLAALGGATVAAILLQPDGSLGAGATPNAAVPDLDASPVAVDMRDVTCWDGTSAITAKQCGVPSGRDGVATIFPAGSISKIWPPLKASAVS